MKNLYRTCFHCGTQPEKQKIPGQTNVRGREKNMLFCGKIVNWAGISLLFSVCKIAATHNGTKKCSFHHCRKEHNDKEELRSLENEISDRFFYKYDVEIENSELDNKRAYLIRKYIF